MTPLSEWKCDCCGKLINTPEKGVVVWKTNEESQPYDFHIVHQSKCRDTSYTNHQPLTTFLGKTGVEWLLSFLSPGKITNLLDPDRSDCLLPADMNEFVDLFRRVQTPFYEEARTKFENEELLSYYSDSNEVTPYLESSLRKMISM